MRDALETLVEVWLTGFIVVSSTLNWRGILRAREDLAAAERGEGPPRPGTLLADWLRAVLWPLYLWRPW